MLFISFAISVCKVVFVFHFPAQARDSHIVTVVFLNETFGNALLPRVIEGPDFDQAISAMELDTDRELFWKWYHWDENAQPPCYKLQPISTFVPNIKVTSPFIICESVEVLVLFSPILVLQLIIFCHLRVI